MDGSKNRGVGMSENGGSPSTDLVEDFVAIDVGNMSAPGRLHEEGVSTHSPEGANRGIHPTGNMLESFGKQAFRLDSNLHRRELRQKLGED